MQNLSQSFELKPQSLLFTLFKTHHHQMSFSAIASTARYLDSTASNSIRPIPSISCSRNLHKTCLISPKIFGKALAANSSNLLRRRGRIRATLDGQSSGGGGEEDADGNRAVEAVHKLYSAIKNQNVRELKEIIHDECRCICNFISFFQPLYGKEQVLDFFISLIRFLGNHIEFRVHHTQQEGMTVGVHWRLEWNKSHFPLGKGFSFHICQIYRGKAVIRNVEMFIEPLVHIEPLRLIIIKYVTVVMDKISSSLKLKPRTRALAAVLLLMAIFSALTFVKH